MSAQEPEEPTVRERPSLPDRDAGEEARVAAGSDTEPDSDERPTAVVTGGRSGASKSMGSRASRPASGDSLPTPQQTLHVEEIQRTRVFVRIASVLAVVVAVAGLFFGDDPNTRGVLVGSLAVTLVGCIWFGWTIRDENKYTPERLIIACYACVIGALGGIYFFGVFSPAPVIIPFGLYFFGLSQSYRATLSVLATCAGFYGVLATLVVSGAVADPGLVSAPSLTGFEKAGVIVLVEGIFIATFIIARATRRANLKALEEHDELVRNLSQREALLREARNDLEQAMRAGGLGRFTDQVIGSYRLGTVLGRGAMGEVYEARHVHDEHPAAVKLMQPHLLSDAKYVRRFVREAKIASQLETPHVVRVYEVGDVDAPTPYIAMERLEGEDLADYLRRHRRLSRRRLLEIVRHAGAGLDAAREAGIVHRDLKPTNLFRARDGNERTWKILDFGVSKLSGGQGTLTHGGLVGTPAYMAPEQASGEDVGHRADLYALGVVCYRALTGRPAFSGRSVPDTVHQVVYGMPPSPREEVTTIPEDVALVLAIAIAKKPEHRFDSGAELAAAFEAAFDEELDEATRRHARTLLERMPWSQSG